jgi:hypothetical protein
MKKPVLTVHRLSLHGIVPLISGDLEDEALSWLFDLHDLTIIIDEVSKLLQVCWKLWIGWKTCWKPTKHLETVPVTETFEMIRFVQCK